METQNEQKQIVRVEGQNAGVKESNCCGPSCCGGSENKKKSNREEENNGNSR